MSRAVVDVLTERWRQIEAEGWSHQHDDTHVNGEMAQAAACYALHSTGRFSPERLWPWHADWWKPKDRRRDLVRAAALIIAEIERLDRINAAERAEDGGTT